MTLIQLDPDDTVAIARTRMQAGETSLGVTLRAAVPAGHKVALRDVAQGEKLLKSRVGGYRRG